MSPTSYWLVVKLIFIDQDAYCHDIEEHDVEKKIYCLKLLAHPYLGGAIGVHKGKLHIVGSAEWVRITVTCCIQIYNLEKAPPPDNASMRWCLFLTIGDKA